MTAIVSPHVYCNDGIITDLSGYGCIPGNLGLPKKFQAAGYGYSKEESDTLFQPKGNYAPSGNYAVKGDSYTKEESDKKYFYAHTNVLKVDLDSLGASSHAGIYYQTQNTEAMAEYHYPVSEAGSLLVTLSANGCQQEYTAFNSGRKFVRGLKTIWNGKDGPWGEWKEYARTGESYSKSESDGRYKNTASKGVAGWLKDTSTGCIRAWGFVSVRDNDIVTVNLPVTFPTACVNLQVTVCSQDPNIGSEVMSAYGDIVSNSQIKVSLCASWNTNLTKGVFYCVEGY
ncbi:pyocin knob domain-containing protein [Morganella morganii]